MRPRVLLDVDGVIADFTSLYLSLVERATGLRFQPSDVTDWCFQKALGLTDDQRRGAEEYFKEPGLALTIKELPGAVEGVKRIDEIADIYFVTSPWDSNPTWSHDRRKWLIQRFGSLGKNVVHTTHKYVVSGDVLVDDKPENLLAWQRHNSGTSVLWDAPYNQDAPGLRMTDWTELENLIKEMAAA